MAAPLYAPQGVELVIKRVDTVCQGPTCKALRAFVKVDERYKIALIYLLSICSSYFLPQEIQISPPPVF